MTKKDRRAVWISVFVEKYSRTRFEPQNLGLPVHGPV